MLLAELAHWQQTDAALAAGDLVADKAEQG
jgi:hypothetical protein